MLMPKMCTRTCKRSVRILPRRSRRANGYLLGGDSESVNQQIEPGTFLSMRFEEQALGFAGLTLFMAVDLNQDSRKMTLAGNTH